MPLRDDLLTPIPGDNPSGENLRYAPIYDKIKEARREDDDAPQGDWARARKVADWAAVIKLSSEAIATKSKDLQLAVWLAEAALRREGFSSFRESLQLIQGLIENFWDTLYPELEDGEAEFRATPLDWLGSRLEPAVIAVPLVKGQPFGLLKYRETRRVPSEEAASESSEVAEQREQALAEGKLPPEEWERALAATPAEWYEKQVNALDACLEALETLQPACEERFGEFAPGWGPLRTQLEEVRHFTNQLWQQRGGGAVEEEAPAEDSSSDDGWGSWSSSDDSSSSTEESAPVRRPAKKRSGPLAAEPADREDAIERVAVAAAFLRRESMSDPAPYLMLRGLRFGELRGQDGTPSYDFLAAPDTETRQKLKQLFNDGSYDECIELAETAMAQPCGRAWLDLQRYVDRCCQYQGYYAVSNAIRSTVKSLVKDLPELTSWTLADDTATANAETLAWLKEFAAEEQPAAESTEESAPAPEPVYYAPPPVYVTSGGAAAAPALEPDSFQLAQQAIQDGRPQQAIELLSQELVAQSSGRGRFQVKLQLAQAFLSMGRHQVAYSLLQELAGMVDRHLLEEWESADMVSHALSLLLRCAEQVQADPAAKQLLFARIVRLNPLQALSFAK